MKCNSFSLSGLRNCNNDANKLCPICIKLGVKKELSSFCSQQCLKDSWVIHKRLHMDAKSAQKTNNKDVDSSISVIEEFVDPKIESLMKKLGDTEDKLLEQQQQTSAYQRISEQLREQVSNLREESKQDFIAACEEEEKYEEAYNEFSEKLRIQDAKWQEKLDHAESESAAAVKLLKVRDENIEKYEQSSREQLNYIEKMKMDNSNLTSCVEKLQLKVDELELQLSQLEGQHKLELLQREETTRKSAEETHKSDKERALCHLQSETKAFWEKAVMDEVANTRKECELERESALTSLRQQLKAESESNLKACIESNRQSSEELMEQLRNQRDLALANQKEELTANHDSILDSVKARFSEELEAAAERLAQVEKDKEEKISVMTSTHLAEISSMKKAYSALEADLDSVVQQNKTLTADLFHCREEIDEKCNVAAQQARNEMQDVVNKAMMDRAEYLELYTKENRARKAIHNKLIDIQGNIRVMCRVRPLLEVDFKQSKGECVDATEIISDEDITIHRDKITKNRFEFDRVFSPGECQSQVFDAIQPLITSVLDGYNVCIFAYGQTGSGKTYTMEGSFDKLEERGVSPRAIDELFKFIDAADNWVYNVKFSMLEIYNETIRDLLLDPSSTSVPKLDIRQTPEGNVVSGLNEVEVDGPEEVLQLMSRGQKNRAVGSHDMNEHSSRSHSILTMTVRGVNNKNETTSFGKLHLIDLAGSERVAKTDATGERLKEAQNINRSLSALGDVINSLGSKKSSHVPYRNSKLTYLLQDSLGGNSKVMMFVNVSPAVYNANESICSLNFAFRCRNVELGQARKQTGNAKENLLNGKDVARGKIKNDKSIEAIKKSSTSAGKSRHGIVNK